MWDLVLGLGVTILATYMPETTLWLIVVRYLHRSYTVVKIVLICYRQIVNELQKQHSSVLRSSSPSPLPSSVSLLNAHPLNYYPGFVDKTSRQCNNYSSSDSISKLNHYTASRSHSTNPSPGLVIPTSSISSFVSSSSSVSSRTIKTYTVAFTGLFSESNSGIYKPSTMNNIKERNVSSGWYYGPVSSYRPLTGPRPPIHRIDTMVNTDTRTHDRQYFSNNQSYVPLNRYNLNQLPLTDNYLRVTQWLKRYVYPRIEQWQTSAELNSHQNQSSSSGISCSNRSSTPIPGTNIPYDEDEFDDDYYNCTIKTKI